jgi:uncharacterized protein (DUF983 family)
MEDYKVKIINEYWAKQVGKKASCPKCKIGKLIKFCSIMCDNCGSSPVRWLIFKT